MFGDNKSVVKSSTHLHAKLHKRHNILSFHQVREAIASKFVSFQFINGKDNPADILSKHWSHGTIWKLLKPVLFWKGDTLEIEWAWPSNYLFCSHNVIRDHGRSLIQWSGEPCPMVVLTIVLYLYLYISLFISLHVSSTQSWGWGVTEFSKS